MIDRWNLLLLPLLLMVCVRAAVMEDDEFKTYLRTLDRRPPAQRVAHLIKPTPDPWDRSDAGLADEILGNFRHEVVKEPPDEKEKRPVKHIIDEDRREAKAKNELKPRSILRRDAQEAPSRKTISVNDTRLKSVRLVEPSIIERATTL